ncbi:MAG: hypothetical protein ACREPM_24775 [Gemmatimonadaceae bacterium]
MTSALRVVVFATLALASSAAAQSIPGAVLAKREPHHHMVYEDSTIRVLRVRVPGHDTTLLHEHDPDYFWIALGASQLVNARPGQPDATIASNDLSIHYTPGKFAHIARNPGGAPFDNITIELLRAQTHVKNLCEPALAGAALACSGDATQSGTRHHPAFSTDQLRVSLVTLDPGATLKAPSPGRPAWIVALDTVDTRSALAIAGKGAWVGGVYRAATGDWSIENRGTAPHRALLIVPVK